MQIFTPAQARNATEERNSKDAQRAKVIVDVTNDLIKERNEAEQAFEATLKFQREKNEAEINRFIDKKNALLSEISGLERRREDLLSPLLLVKNELDSEREAVLILKLQNEAKEQELIEEKRLLMSKLDEVSTLKQDLENRSKLLRTRELGSESQRNQIAHDARRLSVQTSEFYSKVNEKQSEFAFRESELDARSNLLDEREKGFMRREEEIKSAKILLQDQRIQLDKGFEELRKKQNDF